MVGSVAQPKSRQDRSGSGGLDGRDRVLEPKLCPARLAYPTELRFVAKMIFVSD